MQRIKSTYHALLAERGSNSSKEGAEQVISQNIAASSYIVVLPRQNEYRNPMKDTETNARWLPCTLQTNVMNLS